MKTMKKNWKKTFALLLIFAILGTTIMGCMSAKAQMGATGVSLNDAVVARMTARIGSAGDAAALLSQAYAEVGLSEIDGNAIPGSAAAWSALAHERSAAGSPIITLSGIGGDLSYEVAALDHMYQDGAAFYDKTGTLVVFQDRMAISLGSAGTTEEESVRTALAASFGIDPQENLRIENAANPIFSLTDSEVLVVTNTNGSGVPVSAVLVPCITPEAVEESTVEESSVEETEVETSADETDAAETSAMVTEDPSEEDVVNDETALDEAGESTEYTSEDESAASEEETMAAEESSAQETEAESVEIASVEDDTASEKEDASQEEALTAAPESEASEQAIETSYSEAETEENPTEEPASEEVPLEGTQSDDENELPEVKEESESEQEDTPSEPEEELEVLAATEDTEETKTIRVSVEKDSDTKVTVKQNNEELGSADGNVSTWEGLKSVFTGNDGTSTEVDVERNDSVELEASDLSAIGSVEVTTGGDKVTIDLSAVTEGTTIVVNGDADEVKLNSISKNNNVSVRDFESYDEYTSELIGIKVRRTDTTIDFYNTFVNEKAAGKNATIDKLFTEDLISEDNADEIFDLMPTQLVEESPVYEGEDGNYYVVTSVPSVQDQEPLDYQAANRFYTDLGAKYEDIDYIGSGVYRIPAARFDECYTIRSAEDGEASVEFVLGIRIQQLFTYTEEEATGVKAIPTRVTYPNGTVSELISLVDLETGTAATEIFENGMEFLFTPDYYTIALSLNSNQSSPAWIMCSGNYLLYNIGDPRSAEKIDIEIGLNPEAFEVGNAFPASTQILRSTAGVKGISSVVFKDAPAVVDTTELNFGDLYGNKAVYVDGSKVSSDLSVGDTFYWIDDDATITLAGWNDATDAAGNFHRGIGGLTTRLAQGMSNYNSGVQGEVTNWFRNSLNTNDDGSTIPGYTQMTDSAVLSRIASNYASTSIGGQQRFGYITVNPLTSPTKSSNGKKIDLGGTYVAFMCMHAWSGLSTGSTDYQAVVAAIQEFTSDTMTSRDFGFSTHGAENGHDPAVDKALTIAMRVTNIVDENGVRIVSLKACTSVLRVNGSITGNYQCAFSTIKIAYKLPENGKAYVKKESAKTSVTTNNKNYTFEGIQYAFYQKDSPNVVAKTADGKEAIVSLKADGTSDAIEMKAGTYQLKEYSVPENCGYTLSPASTTVTVEAEKTTSFTVSDEPVIGYLSMIKMSAKPEITDGNSCYDMTGIQYTVYTDEFCTKVAKRADNQDDAVFTLDRNGRTTSIPVALGSYWIKETYNPEGSGYFMNPLASDRIDVTAKNPNPGTKFMFDMPTNDPFGIEIVKEAAVPGAITDLSGAEYTIKYYAGQYSSISALPSTATHTWIIKTIKQGNNTFTARLHDSFLVSGTSAPYGKNAASGAYNIPLGTLTVEEAKAPYGFKTAGSEMYDAVSGVKYDKTGEIFLFNLTADGEGIALKNANQVSDAGDGIKIRQTELALSPEIGTKAFDKENGTNHILASEETVLVDTVSYRYLYPNTGYILKGILMDRETEEPLLIDGEEVTAVREFTTGDSDTGSEEVEFRFDGTKAAGKTLVVFEKLYKADNENVEAFHEDLNDEGQTVYIPEIGTTATAPNTNDHVIGEEEEVTITDIVSYKGLKPGKAYVMKGTIMDREYKAPLIVNGQKVTVEKEFVPKTSEGFEEITFSIPSIGLRGTTLVIFEECYMEDALAALHADISDNNQAVYIPEIHTLAYDSKTGIDHTNAEEDAVLTDTVFYSHLLPDREYSITGILMNKVTNEPFLDRTGATISKTKEFTPVSEEGTVNVDFQFDATLIQGETIVVFEYLYLDGILIAEHTDIESDEQTDYIPELYTSAWDNATKDRISNASEEILIHDNVFYSGLKPATKYVLSGTLIDKVTGHPIIDANGFEATGSAVILTDSDNISISGTAVVDFTINGKDLKNRTVVIFEDLYTSGKLVGVHASLENESQTVYFPEIKTSAKDVETGDHLGHLSDSVVIEDEVFYENLIPGKEYTVSGVLMVKEDESILIQNGKEIRQEKQFVPDQPSGSTTLSFTVDSALLSGKTVVVFEDLLYNGVQVASHAEIDDENQSIHFPKVRTNARDEKKGGNVLTFGEQTVVIDAVSFENLIPGKMYTVKGVVMDKQTGEATGITGEADFTPKAASGEAEVKFTMNVTVEMKDKSFVIFEELFTEDGILIAEHKDINDEAQTVNVIIGTARVDKPNPRRSETPILGINKDFSIVIIVFSASILMGLCGVIAIKKKMGSRKK